MNKILIRGVHKQVELIYCLTWILLEFSSDCCRRLSYTYTFFHGFFQCKRKSLFLLNVSSCGWALESLISCVYVYPVLHFQGTSQMEDWDLFCYVFFLSGSVSFSLSLTRSSSWSNLRCTWSPMNESLTLHSCITGNHWACYKSRSECRWPRSFPHW